jgi:hypothetical protein
MRFTRRCHRRHSHCLGYDRGHRRRSEVRTYETSTTGPTSRRGNLYAPRRAIARPCIADLARGVADQRIHDPDPRRRRRGDAMNTDKARRPLLEEWQDHGGALMGSTRESFAPDRASG